MKSGDLVMHLANGALHKIMYVSGKHVYVIPMYKKGEKLKNPSFWGNGTDFKLATEDDVEYAKTGKRKNTPKTASEHSENSMFYEMYELVRADLEQLAQNRTAQGTLDDLVTESDETPF